MDEQVVSGGIRGGELLLLAAASGGRSLLAESMLDFEKSFREATEDESDAS